MKKPQSQLKQEIREAAMSVDIGSVYAHYKDPAHTYKVIDLAINAEDSTVWVIYQALYDEQVVFLRSVKEWCDDVEKDGSTLKRFELVKSQTS